MDTSGVSAVLSRYATGIRCNRATCIRSRVSTAGPLKRTTRTHKEVEMMTTRVRNLAVLVVAVGCLPAASALVAFAGDLEPPGPPAPTMRTLDSLGFDCPSDVAAQRTNLIYTFVTSNAGFDTGLSISNTGADPFGTVPPACPGNGCRCILNFYGNGAPMPVTSPSIAAGQTYANLASILAPNFTGYLIATCNFPYAHGFGFISDLGARNLAMGYLAQVVCSDRGSTAMGAGR